MTQATQNGHQAVDDAVDADAGAVSLPGAGVVDDEPETDLARSVLDAARATSRRRGPGRSSRSRTRRENLAGRASPTGRNRGGYSGPGPDPERDPQPIGALVPGLVSDQGWERPLADARVFADWEQLVGADIAAHAHPQSLHAGELRISAESTAWATQLRLLSSRLLARLVAELGPDTVTKLIITGPAAPSWRHGNRTVRGHRGPRDTYG